MNQEIFDELFEHIKKSMKFTNSVEIRNYGINLAKENEANLKKDIDYFYLEFGVYKGTSTNFFAKKVKN